MTSSDTAGAAPRKTRTLWILLLLFSLPYAVAALFYYFDDLREQLPTANHGELLTPPRQLPDVVLQSLDGQEFSVASLRGQWVLLFQTRTACDRACEETMYFMRQVRLAMGRERFKIERVALLPSATEPRILAELARHQAEMHRLRSDDPVGTSLLAGLADAGDNQSHLYVLDPVGRAVLRYSAPLQPKDLLSDLKRLIGGRGRG